MRQSLLFGGLEAIVHNSNRKSSDLLLFETGNCYFHYPEIKNKEPLDNYHEEQHLSLFLTGNKNEVNWMTEQETVNFYHIKSTVEKILLRLGINPDQADVNDVKNEIFSYGLNYKFNNESVVDFGAISKKIKKIFDLDAEIFYADFQWKPLFSLAKSGKVSYVNLPRFPEVRRDLALLIDKNISFGQIKKSAFKTEKKLLTRISIFDIYEGEKLGENKKSYAITFFLQDNEKTMTDFLIDNIMNNLIKAFEKELGATIR
ncbi:MAG: hypothetical protein NTW49_05455 [Bacteroidia bacterium]|nr:hypothetical protein [Bacteroidia bacterium]